MKKVAIQMAANPRSFRRVYESFKRNLIDQFEFDLFIHTWRLHGSERPDVVTDGTCEEYVELYKPTSYLIEDLHYSYQPLQTMIPHFTSRWKTNQLRLAHEKETGKKYDVVICHRPDVKLRNPFKEEYLDLVGEDNIFIHHFKDGIPADYHFFTSPKWMNITADCFNEIDLLPQYNPGSERLWWYKLQKEGFLYENFRFYGNSTHNQEHIDNSLKLYDIECVR
jgi:hypothetical protein